MSENDMRSCYVTVTCQHVSSSAVHCNKYKEIPIYPDETLREAIEDSPWAIVGDEYRCPEHHGDDNE